MAIIILLILVGFVIGTFGTLIGAGGGFVLVPLLILFYPQFSPETITAISMAVVAVNAISGSFAYAKSGRIDYKAGILFSIYTIPGSIVGVLSVKYIPQNFFNIIFGLLLLLLSIYLFYKNKTIIITSVKKTDQKDIVQQSLTDKEGEIFKYSYNKTYGIIISIVVGYISPLLGIGGGIIHVPAMVNWLRFPIYIATATSHFILAVMATVSVIVHIVNGNYTNSDTLQMVMFLSIGVIPGAQMGVFLSHKIKSQSIIKILAICLLLVGLRIVYKSV